MPATTYNKGWSEGAWGYNGWGGIAPAYIVDGVAGTGAVGTVVVKVNETIAVTGVSGTGSVGTVAVKISETVAVTEIGRAHV